MKSFCSFLIVALAVATSMLPSVYSNGRACGDYCLSCQVKSGCNENFEDVPLEECSTDQACIVVDGNQECMSYENTECKCENGNTACDPYDNTKKITCDGVNLVSEDCPAGHICVGDGECQDPNAPTKPATCTADNANTRYPHDTDCKKYYFCRESSTDTYLYVESRCPGSLVYNKDTTYCDLPGNVPDCQQ